MSDYWFFLSYTRVNDPSYTQPNLDGQENGYVRRFYEDLAAEIVNRGNTGQQRTPKQIGFFDQACIQPGDVWYESVAEALRTTRVLICLYTKNYFRSEVSGQEVEIFRAREQEYAQAQATPPPPFILPVLWHGEAELEPDKSLPSAVSDLQYTYNGFPNIYRNMGLEFMLRQKSKHEDDYQEFLVKFTSLLVKRAEAVTLPPLPARPVLKTARNAFAATPPAPSAPAPSAPATSTGRGGRGRRRRPTGHAPATPTVLTANIGAASAATRPLENLGPGFAHFVFVAGQSQELQGVRQRLEAYGAESRLWKPYLPEADRPVGLLTQRAATEVGLLHEVLPVSPALLEQLVEADDTNTIVVLVVDPWSLKIAAYENLMVRYNRSNLVSCAMLVLWNDQEQEPNFNPAELRTKVNTTFPNILINKNIYVRPSVNSEATLNEEVKGAIHEIRRRLDERAKLKRQVDDAGYKTAPQVAGPSGGMQ